MAFDSSTLSPPAREGYIRIGRSFSSVDTLAQANLTLSGLEKHGPELVRHGFGGPDAQRLLDARDALQAERVGRAAEVGEKRVSREAVREALARAGGERDAVRSILSGASGELLETGDEVGARTIRIVLQRTAVKPRRDAGLFADQLEHLCRALTDPALAPTASARGGPEAAADLASTIALLRAADRGQRVRLAREHRGDQEPGRRDEASPAVGPAGERGEPSPAHSAGGLIAPSGGHGAGVGGWARRAAMGRGAWGRRPACRRFGPWHQTRSEARHTRRA